MTKSKVILEANVCCNENFSVYIRYQHCRYNRNFWNFCHSASVLQIWQVGNILRYSAQCVLVINMFNEKIFIFLWFWYMLLVTCTLLSFAYWLITLTVPCFNRWFISQSLELSDMKFDPESKHSSEGFFCKMISWKVNDWVSSTNSIFAS